MEGGTCIFLATCCIGLRAGNKGCRHCNLSTTAHAVHTAGEDGAAGMFGSPACQNPLCERSCLFYSCWALQPAVWIDWAGQPDHLREAELCRAAHPGLLLDWQAGWWLQLVLRGGNGQRGCWAAPRHQSLPKEHENLYDPCSQSPCGHSSYRTDLCGV